MADIKVDPDKLDDLARELAGLREEFAGLRGRVDEYEGFIGHRRLSEELRSTADNWSKKREELLEDLDALARMASEAAHHYRCLEINVAASFQRAPSGPA